MRRALILALVGAVVVLTACSSDGGNGNGDADPPSNPMNAVVELGRPVDRGYERTEWDPAAQAAALALAGEVAATSIGCLEPGPVSFGQVKQSHELVKLPMPAAVVSCTSVVGEEDLLFSAFVDEEAKDTFVEAKAELICGRALSFGMDQSNDMAGFDGIVYVDTPTIIIEPDSYVVRDQLAQELGATASKMCPEAVGDRPPTTTAGSSGA